LEQEPNTSPSTATAMASSDLSLYEGADIVAINEPSKRDVRLAGIIRRERRMIPWQILVFSVLILGGIVAYTLLKGPTGKTSIVGIEPCSWGFWTVLAATVPYFTTLIILVGLYLSDYHKIKLDLGFPYLESDVKWSFRMVVIYSLIGLLAGVSAGLLGVSSGMIIGPILLQLKLLPTVITATTAFMIIFAQTSVSLQYILFGTISWKLGLYYIGTGACASLLGQVVLYIKNRISKRDSLLALLMATVVAVSCILLLVVGIYEQITYHLPYDFRPLC